MKNITLIHGDGIDWVRAHRPAFIVSDPPLNLMNELGRLCQDLEIARIFLWADEWLSNKHGRGETNHPGEKDVEPYFQVIRQFDYPVVVDPFMGSGTVGVAALKAGKQFIGIEINENWYTVAHKRIHDSIPDAASGTDAA